MKLKPGKKNDTKYGRRQRLAAGAISVSLVLAMGIGIVAPLVQDFGYGSAAAPSVSVSGFKGEELPEDATNVERLMQAGLPEGKAEVIAGELESMGCGKLTGIKPEDNGDGYLVTFYGEDDAVYYMGLLDYYGNVLQMMEVD